MRSTLLALLLACSAVAAPYRFLLVAGNQWDDDASFVIDRPSEFQVTAALLKPGVCRSISCGWISRTWTDIIFWIGTGIHDMAPSFGTLRMSRAAISVCSPI